MPLRSRSPCGVPNRETAAAPPQGDVHVSAGPRPGNRPPPSSATTRRATPGASSSRSTILAHLGLSAEVPQPDPPQPPPAYATGHTADVVAEPETQPHCVRRRLTATVAPARLRRAALRPSPGSGNQCRCPAESRSPREHGGDIARLRGVRRRHGSLTCSRVAKGSRGPSRRGPSGPWRRAVSAPWTRAPCRTLPGDQARTTTLWHRGAPTRAPRTGGRRGCGARRRQPGAARADAG